MRRATAGCLLHVMLREHGQFRHLLPRIRRLHHLACLRRKH
jgi:hypothetical protein